MTIYLLNTYHDFQAELEWDYSLNLSILIREGKETNKDCLSNGE
jgi:hypothetical protein